MIAVVTSCISPEGTSKSSVSIDDRMKQTIFTLNKLLAVGFENIILVDNSSDFDLSAIPASTSAKVIGIQQYQFKNKGINELLMLLTILKDLPENTPIFKMSGRYFPNDNFFRELPEGFDFKVRAYNFESRRGTISTRAYFVKNKAIFEDFLLKSLNEIYTYPGKITGLRSLGNRLKSLVGFTDTYKINISIEFAAARVLKSGGYKVLKVNPIGISGQIAGAAGAEQISE